ncbi:aspartic peptidase domain-containing protein [Massariosphaeria phaeospora]|uniref:Aspartic peptidase domain-containing protein n=1 Tax=Massariosphaeria phaeospora TaxID=100035 RepID=A0A7C8I0Z0_9PLEO|nr:aspartic peptidase domain-containing protein [Massariosphaeria phaeospora]
MLYKINACILTVVGFLVLSGSSAAVPDSCPIVLDLVRIRGTNDGAYGKRDPAAVVENLEQHLVRLGINLNIKGQDYLLNIDTGSLITWVAYNDFTCYDKNMKIQDQDKCHLGPKTFKGTYLSYGPFDQRYGGGEWVSGDLAKETVKLGDKDVENVSIGYGHDLFWVGDHSTVGIFGMTSDPDEPALWLSLCKQHKLPLQFTLAVNREEDGDEHGGSIAFGGTLDGELITPDAWTTVDVAECAVSNWFIEGFKLSFDRAGTVHTEDVNTMAVVDSGDPRIRLPKKTLAAFLAAWSTAPEWAEEINSWAVKCNVKGPDALHFEIGGTKFKVPVRDNIMIQDGDDCFFRLLGINQNEAIILGLPFMRHVVINHDWEKRKMSFKQRVYT